MKVKILKKKKNSQDSFSFIREVPIDVEERICMQFGRNESESALPSLRNFRCFVSDYFEHDSW